MGNGWTRKTTLVEDIYHNKLSDIVEKHACVTVMCTFSPLELLRSLFMQLDREHSKKKVVLGLMAST
jgi:hypothetical protein